MTARKEDAALPSLETVVHTLKPVFAPDARVLILGTMPSPKSREVRFYYGHPQNRFWRVMTVVLEEPALPLTNADKSAMMRRHRIALWDVLHSCKIAGASDASIQEPAANPISGLIHGTAIHKVFTTGRRAYNLYEKLVYPETGVHATALPSTSPANCRMSLQELVAAYQCMRDALECPDSGQGHSC